MTREKIKQNDLLYYINEGKNQDETIGFIEGWEKGYSRADQETQSLKAELAEKDNLIKDLTDQYTETVYCINKLREVQTEQLNELQSELTEKDKDIEMLKQSVDRHETDYSDLQNRNIFLKEKFDNSLKTVKALSGELTELKEKHKRDVEQSYDKGYSDATTEAVKEINKNYRPNDHL
jgi:chromosome segregation ATPase